MINLVEVFWTFQGEGAHAGRRALFVRMPFCNLKCAWCDTEFNKFTTWSEEQLQQFALKERSRFAVITGGEPTMNRHTPIVIAVLKNLGFEIAIESNGTFPIPDRVDFVTLSPKRDANYKTNPLALHRADEIKLVVDQGFDFEIARAFNSMPGHVRLSLSPEYGNMAASLQLMEQFIKENPRWRISLQTHKWMGMR